MMPCVMAVPAVYAYTVNSGRDFSFLASAGYVLIGISVLHPLMIFRYVHIERKRAEKEAAIEDAKIELATVGELPTESL